MMGYFGYGGYHWVGMIVGLVITAAVITGIVLLIIWAVRQANRNSQPVSHTPAALSPKELAQARYARGEISREEYQQILSDLER